MPVPFIERLHAHLSENPFRKKIILASSRAHVLQWLEQVVRHYGSIEHVEVGTVESLVMNEIKLDLHQKGWRYLHSQESYWIIQRLMRESADDDSYLSNSQITPGMVRRMASSIRELRETGISSTEFKPEACGIREKGEYLKTIFARYEHYLNDHRLADFSTAVPKLSERQASHEFPLILLHDQLFLSITQRRALEKIAGESIIPLLSDQAFTSDPKGYRHHEFFHATGTFAEIRHVFRLISSRGLSCDQVELILSDPERSTNAVSAIANQLQVPCTFSDGLPMTVRPLGRTARLYVRWVESNFHADHLVYALRQGWIRIPQSEGETISSGQLAHLLEQSGVGWGMERYELLERLAIKHEEGSPERRGLFLLHAFCHALIEPYQDPNTINPLMIWTGLQAFIEQYAHFHSDQDMYIIHAIKDHRNAMLLMANQPMSIEASLPFVTDLLDRIRVEVEPIPKPGAIHVSSLHTGGLSGRTCTFIVGMDEKAWSMTSRQDPILLDGERKAIHPALLTSSDQVTQAQEERSRRLSCIEGTVILGYSSYRIDEGQALSPAYEMLQLFRMHSGHSDAAEEDLLRHMGTPVHYADPSASPLDATDGWLGRLVLPNDQLRSGVAAIHHAYPFLKAGKRATESRQSAAAGEFDGLIDTTRHPIRYMQEESKPLSASRLERYGGCPLQYFYQSVLGVYPKEKPEFDRSQWLDPLQRGSLFHSVYERYMTYTLKHGHSQEKLREITEQIIGEFTEEVPAPSPAIHQKECELIRRDLEIFYRIESARTSIPKYFELPIHGEDPAFRLEMGEEFTIPLKGFVDRVDEWAPHRYRILDYKTGSTYKYRRNEYFGGGTQLQHALYAWAVEQWLHRTGADPEAQVTEAVYVFPTERGMGEEIALPQNRREELTRLLSRMIKGMEDGLYPPTDQKDTCRWCDYQTVCGRHADFMKAKYEDSDNAERLAPWLEVRAYE